MSIKTLGQLNSQDSLIIFDRFQVDYTLPKFSKENQAEDDEDGEGQASKSTRMRVSYIVGEELTIGAVVPKKLSWWRRLFSKRVKEPKLVPVPHVFDLVLQNDEELKLVQTRVAAFQELIDRAKTSGQKSLVRQLEAERNVDTIESVLLAKGMKRYISEAQLLKFAKGCEKGLCLDWIEHFVRVIPKEVVATKAKCDEAGVFDNYVVLHFDPDSKATTEEDRKKAKDPILFGIMQGSRKLYFVGDWVDEYCDLTIQQILDKLGYEEETEIL